MKNSKKIMIVEHSSLIINGLLSFFEDSSNINVVAKLENIEHIESKISSLSPDILIINPIVLSLSERNILKQLAHLFPQMIFVAIHSSYIEQNVLRQFKEVIELNDNKQTVLSKIYNLFNDNNNAIVQNENFELSNRETDVLIAVAKGMSNKEISDRLNISIHTVMTHRKNIIKKTGIRSVSGLTVYALLNNLIEENEVV